MDNFVNNANTKTEEMAVTNICECYRECYCDRYCTCVCVCGYDDRDAYDEDDDIPSVGPSLQVLHKYVCTTGISDVEYLFERGWFCRSQSLQELLLDVIFLGKAKQIDVFAGDFREHLEELLWQEDTCEDTCEETFEETYDSTSARAAANAAAKAAYTAQLALPIEADDKAAAASIVAEAVSCAAYEAYVAHWGYMDVATRLAVAREEYAVAYAAYMSIDDSDNSDDYAEFEAEWHTHLACCEESDRIESRSEGRKFLC